MRLRAIVSLSALQMRPATPADKPFEKYHELDL